MILFGFRGKRKGLGAVVMACPQCNQTCSQAIVRMQRWFTLFFIPIFPFSTKYYTVCSMCSAATRVDRERAEHLSRTAGAQGGERLAAELDDGGSPPTSRGDAAAAPFPPVHGDPLRGGPAQP